MEYKSSPFTDRKSEYPSFSTNSIPETAIKKAMLNLTITPSTNSKNIENVVLRQNPAAKNPMLNKLRDYKSELARLKRESQLASRAANEANNRSQLLAGAELDDSGAPTSSSQRDRMAQATQQLDRTGNRIQDGKRTLLETEDLGVSILQDLHRQRDTISSAREHIHAADDTIGRSRKILQSMGRRAMANKAMLYGIIAMLFGAILLVAYFKLFRSSDDDSGGE